MLYDIPLVRVAARRLSLFHILLPLLLAQTSAQTHPQHSTHTRKSPTLPDPNAESSHHVSLYGVDDDLYGTHDDDGDDGAMDIITTKTRTSTRTTTFSISSTTTSISSTTFSSQGQQGEPPRLTTSARTRPSEANTTTTVNTPTSSTVASNTANSTAAVTTSSTSTTNSTKLAEPTMPTIHINSTNDPSSAGDTYEQVPHMMILTASLVGTMGGLIAVYVLTNAKIMKSKRRGHAKKVIDLAVLLPASGAVNSANNMRCGSESHSNAMMLPLSAYREIIPTSTCSSVNSSNMIVNADVTSETFFGVAEADPGRKSGSSYTEVAGVDAGAGVISTFGTPGFATFPVMPMHSKFESYAIDDALWAQLNDVANEPCVASIPMLGALPLQRGLPDNAVNETFGEAEFDGASGELVNVQAQSRQQVDYPITRLPVGTGADSYAIDDALWAQLDDVANEPCVASIPMLGALPLQRGLLDNAVNETFGEAEFDGASREPGGNASPAYSSGSSPAYGGASGEPSGNASPAYSSGSSSAYGGASPEYGGVSPPFGGSSPAYGELLKVQAQSRQQVNYPIFTTTRLPVGTGADSPGVSGSPLLNCNMNVPKNAVHMSTKELVDAKLINKAFVNDKPLVSSVLWPVQRHSYDPPQSKGINEERANDLVSTVVTSWQNSIPSHVPGWEHVLGAPVGSEGKYDRVLNLSTRDRKRFAIAANMPESTLVGFARASRQLKVRNALKKHRQKEKEKKKLLANSPESRA